MTRSHLICLGLVALLTQTPSAASSNALERVEVGEGEGPSSMSSTFVYQCRDLVIELRHQRDVHSRSSTFTAVLVNGRRLKPQRMQALNAKVPAHALVLLPSVTCLTQSIGLWVLVKSPSGLDETPSAFRFRLELSDDFEAP